MKNLLLALLGALCILAADTSDGNGAKTYQSKSTTSEGELMINDGKAKVQYVLKDDDSVDFTLTVKGNNWFGLGFGKNMEKVDMLCTQLDGAGGVEVADLWAETAGAPSKDTTQDFTVVGIQLSLRRTISSRDANQDTVLKKDETYEWAWAYSETATMEKHTSKGTIKLNFGKDGVFENEAEEEDEVDEKEDNSYLLSSLLSLGLLCLVI